MRTLTLFSALTLIFMVNAAVAQKHAVTAETSFIATTQPAVVNGKAILLLKPRYPPAAKAVKATGQVPVQVLIDTDGSMFSAEAVGGHPLLRSSSVAAACGSKFTLTSLSGKPVRVSGIINYNFAP